jgi:hypothetical protein
MAFCLFFPDVPPAIAVEGGGSHYFGGNEDFGAGSWPPHGLSANLSVLNFNFDRLKDSDGKTMSIPGGFQVDGVSTSLRVMYTTKLDVLGATVGWFITPALVYQHILSAGRTKSKTEMGDLNFGVILKQNFKNFSHVLGSDIFAPTGSYSKDDVNNIGLNYWTLGPTYAFTYVTGLDSPLPGFEVSARLAYYFHTENTATNYTSGQEFTVDYLVGKWFGDRGQYKIGVNGHFSWQTTDDAWRYAPPDFDGHRTRQFTIGPAFQYVFPNNALLTLKVQWGVYDINHGEGNNFWLKFWYPLYLF